MPSSAGCVSVVPSTATFRFWPAGSRLSSSSAMDALKSPAKACSVASPTWSPRMVMIPWLPDILMRLYAG